MWSIESTYQQARTAAAARAEFIRNVAELRLGLFHDPLSDFPYEESVQRMLELHRQRLEAVPDLDVYPELRGMRELIAAEWRGTQDGAGLDDVYTAAFYTGYFYYTRQIRGGVPATGCSDVYFPTSDVGPLFAANLDSTPQEKFGLPDWPLANEHLIIGGVSSGIYMDELSPEIFPAPVHKLVGRYCRNTDEAVEMFTRYNLFWGPCNHIVIDRNHKVAMIEKSACRIGVRYSPDGFGFITAMHAEEPGMHAYLEDRRAASVKARGLPAECNDTRYWRGAAARQALMTELLDEARQNPTLEKMRQIMQFRDPQRGYVCYNAEVFHPDDFPVEYTLRTQITLLEQGKAQWWAKEGDTPSFENRKPDVEFNDVLRWES